MHFFYEVSEKVNEDFFLFLLVYLNNLSAAFLRFSHSSLSSSSESSSMNSAYCSSVGSGHPFSSK